MSFAAASGLWLGLIALPVVVLYILKIKRHRRIVPYLKMWADLVADRQFSTLFQKLQRLFSLLLQLLIAACLVCAFAAMTLSDSYLKEESVVLVVDRSASMWGLERPDGERTRFAAAIERARDLVEGRSPEDEFAVVMAGAQPEVVQGFTRSTLRLREALEEPVCTFASGDLRAAHRLACDLLQDKEHPRVVLLADRAGGAARALEDEDPAVRWIRIGETVDNLGILRFQARKNHDVGTDYLLAVVANLGREAAKANLEIHLEGKLRKVLPLELEAGGEFSETLELSLVEGGFAKAVLVHPPVKDGDREEPGADGLALDDVAYAAVAPARRYRILLVARDRDEVVPFQAAFTALSSLVDGTSRSGTLEYFEGLTDEQRAGFDLVLFVNVAPERLPAAGNYFCINALPGGLPAEARGVERQPRIREIDRGHPLNRFLEPKGMQPALARPVDLSGGEPFMQTGGGPVGVVFRDRRRKVVYLGLDVIADLFFLQVAFPIMLRNALGWMHEEESRLLEPTYRPGDVIRPRFSVADDTVHVEWRRTDWWDEPRPFATDVGEAAAGGATTAREIEVQNGTFAFAETAWPGRYRVRAGQRDYLTTVNLFDRTESDLTMPEPPAEARELDVERSGFLFGRDLWPLLLLIAAFLWVVEWGLYHRRFTE